MPGDPKNLDFVLSIEAAGETKAQVNDLGHGSSRRDNAGTLNRLHVLEGALTGDLLRERSFHYLPL